jgi:hypothetical protein
VRGGLAVAVQPDAAAAPCPGCVASSRPIPSTCLEQKTSKAVGLGDRRLWAGRRQHAADLSRQRRPRRLLPAARRRCAERQRPAHRLCAGGDPRGRLRAAGRGREAMLAGSSRLRRRPDRAQGPGRRGPTSMCESSPRIEALSRYGRAQAKDRSARSR